MSRQPFIPIIYFLFVVLGARGEKTAIHLYQRGYVAGSKADATRLTDEAVAAFERRHAEIAVNIVGLPWSREGDLKLRAVLLNRHKIDCFRVTNDQLPDFIPRKGDLLSPVDPYLTAEDFTDIAPNALEAVRHNGKIMAWPLWSTALPLIGNTAIMKERGIEPPPQDRPWTWDEFVAALKKGTFMREDGEEVWGLTTPARPPLFEWSPLLWAHAGPVFLKSGSREGLNFAPGLEAALKRVAELKEWGVVPRTFGTDDQPSAWAQFLSGNATFILTTPALIRQLAAKNFSYVILPPPTGDYGKPITTGALGAFAVVAHPEDRAREEAAHLLARYLTSAEIADEVKGWYLAPPVRKSIRSFAENPAYAGLMEIVPTAVYLNPPGGAGFLESTIIPEFQSAMMGKVPPDRAIRQITEGFQRRQLN